MRKLLGLCAGMALILCSCSTVKTITYTESRTLEPTSSIHAVPLIADLQVSETRISYAENVSADLSSLSEAEARRLTDELKATVLANAVKKHNADVLVLPVVEVQGNGLTQMTITVTGYPAVYKNFRNASKDDLWFIEVAKPIQVETVAPQPRTFRWFGK